MIMKQENNKNVICLRTRRKLKQLKSKGKIGEKLLRNENYLNLHGNIDNLTRFTNPNFEVSRIIILV